MEDGEMKGVVERRREGDNESKEAGVNDCR